ncbi:MAG: NAD(P)H-hydrate dehydratase [Thermodesulfovibrionales bacterium]|nr:NAD(P)H-hydrate dehydratase [Thermodesulfovibrionales bacterium]
MKVVTAEEMRVIDRRTIEEYGILSVVLMERAGLAVASKIKELFGKSKDSNHQKVIVLAGSGNNGGDGLVVARNLHNECWDVKVFLTPRPEDLKGDALLQYNAAVKFGVDIRPIKELLKQQSVITPHSIIVDALLGTGLSKNVTGMLSEVISLLNRSNIPIISVDIPSGISSDNGQVMGEAVKADYTVTFGLPKRGHLLFPGAQHTGKLFIEDIGFPEELLRSDKLNVELLMKNEVSPLIPQRHRYSYKGDYGHVLIIAGSRGKTGAALMAAKACLRSGAGLVTIGVPESLAEIFQSRVTEEMTLILPDKGDGTLSEKASRVILNFLDEKADIIAIGPGIGVSADTRKLMEVLIRNSRNPMVVDADGINSLKGGKKVFVKAKAPMIFTPHPGEMARLLNQPPFAKGGQGGITVSTQDIEKDRINTALSFAKETGAYLVLKGVPTIIAGPDGRAYINSTGNPGMATAGTGDVLTGMISGFLGQGIKPFNASILGVYMHGLAGDIAASEKGEHPLIATDIIDKIPVAFRSLSIDMVA